MSGFLLPKALLQLCQLSVRLKFILLLAMEMAISLFHEKLQKVIANNCSLCRHYKVSQKFNLQNPWLVVTVLACHAILNTNKQYCFLNLFLRKKLVMEIPYTPHAIHTIPQLFFYQKFYPNVYVKLCFLQSMPVSTTFHACWTYKTIYFLNFGVVMLLHFYRRVC